MLRLRTSSGISAQEYEKMFLLPFDPIEEVMRKYRGIYTARTDQGRWRLNAKGFLISNSIISDLLIIQDDSVPIKRI